MKILVTGGAGYCGVPLCEKLLADGHHVTVVDNFMFGFEPILHLVSSPRLDVIKRDIRHEDMSYLDGKDVVFHLAGISGYPACEANPHSAKLINVSASVTIAKLLSPSQLLVFPSTTSFYGSQGDLSTEETIPKPVSLYGITKVEGEKIFMDRPNSISLRWATVFGVGSRMRNDLMVNDFVDKAVNERTIVLYDADSRRTFIHLNDVVRGYLFALEHQDKMSGGVFNMGSDRLNYTKREIAKKIQETCPCDVLNAELGDTDVRNFLVCFDKIKAIGFDCNNTLEQGIAELSKLYRFYTPSSAIRPI
ncbi:MAG: NAD(P)-dependent oxidoreductase [Rhodobacteraceae bacterium]|nr:NAD(P)-dependent oxidoreductase [Paracoccaceae bacterium]